MAADTGLHCLDPAPKKKKNSRIKLRPRKPEPDPTLEKNPDPGLTHNILLHGHNPSLWSRNVGRIEYTAR